MNDTDQQEALFKDKPPMIKNFPDLISTGNSKSWAIFSACRQYRYLLGRSWDAYTPLFICGMLNPSIANAERDDPTIRRVIGFAKRHRFGGIIVWNVAALIATDPRDLIAHRDPIGPDNHEVIGVAVRSPILAKSIVACGRPVNKKIEHLVRSALMVANGARPLWCIGKPTKQGWPRHPLYLRADASIEHYTMP